MTDNKLSKKENIKEIRLTKKEIKDIWKDVIAFMEGLRNEGFNDK